MLRVLVKFILLLTIFIANIWSFFLFAVDIGELEDMTPKALEDAWWDFGSVGDQEYWIQELLKKIWQNIILPIIIVIWLIVASVNFYKLAFSSNEEERNKARWFFIWWVAWIIAMVSAVFIWEELVWNTWNTGIFGDYQWEWVDIATNLYEKIILPFVSIWMYLIVAILFIILLITVIKFLFVSDTEEVPKNTKTIIVWNTIWILFILLSQNIVKLVYGSKPTWSTNLWNISDWMLEKNDLSWLHTVLNYFLWFLAIVITAFIIYQAFLLLTKPDDEWTLTALKKNFVYVLVGVLIMWWVYIIANFFIIR